eukprot:s4802_g3.t1
MARVRVGAVLALGLVGLCSLGALESFVTSRQAEVQHAAGRGVAARLKRRVALRADGSLLRPFGPVVAYAKVLMDTSETTKEFVQVASDVMDVKDAFADAEFLDSLSLIQNNYNLTNVQKAEKIIELLKPEGEAFQSSVMPKFIVFLGKKNRLRGLKEICNDFMQSLYFNQGIAPVIVRTAERLSEDQKARIKEKMCIKAECAEIKLIDQVDANLIAGFTITWGFVDPVRLEAPSHGIDLSLRRILNKGALQVGGLVEAL